MANESMSAFVPATEAVSHDGWHATSASMSAPAESPEALKADLEAPSPFAQPPAAPVPSSPLDAPGAHEPSEADTPPAVETATLPPTPKKRTSEQRVAEIQARIAAETRAFHEVRRARETEAAEVARLKAERDAITAGRTPTPARDTTSAPHAATDDMPTWEAFEADGQPWDTYQRALVAWKDARDARVLSATEAEIRAKVQQDVVREQHVRARAQAEEQADAAFQARQAAVAAEHPDYYDVVEANLVDIPTTDFIKDVVQTHPAGSRVLYHWATHPDEAKALASAPMTFAVMDVVTASDDPVPLLSYLATHPDERDAILNTVGRGSTFEEQKADARRLAVMALTRLDTKLAATGATPAPGPPSPAPVTRATAPLRPVAGVRTAGAAADDDLDSLPLTEYVRRMNEKDRATRRL